MDPSTATDVLTRASIPTEAPPLIRGITVYRGYVRKPCTICHRIVPFSDVHNCTRYSGGKLLCSNNCRDMYIIRNGELPPT